MNTTRGPRVESPFHDRRGCHITQLAILDATTGETVGGPLDARVGGIAFHPERPELLLTNAGRLSVHHAQGLTVARTLEHVEARPLDVAWSPDVRRPWPP